MPADRILISPTAFKGTLSPQKASLIIKNALKRYYKAAQLITIPLADGGDGTLEVLAGVLRGRVRHAWVHGPLKKKVRAEWGQVGKTAVIEMARASGLALVKKNKILEATSLGTGELIKKALRAGCQQIFIGVGGTATSEGGAGALHALGLRYFDKKNRLLAPTPKELIRLHRVDWSGLDPRLKKTKLTVLCDVQNPLLGVHGSARTFGPQKGASPQDVQFLEKVLKRWSKFEKYKSKNKPGAGAAGALAYGLAAFAGAELVKGAPVIMKALKWDGAAHQSNVIITGEGKLDQTSFKGKVIGAVIKRKQKAAVYAICGDTSLNPKEIKKKGLNGVVLMGTKGLTSPQATLKSSAELLAHILFTRS